MNIILPVIFIAWCAEAFFAGSETAFISVNFLKIMHLIEKKNKRALLVHNLLKKPDRLLVTTLIGTNLFIVVSSACATAFFAQISMQYGPLLTIIVMAPISFIFCQLLPKTIFRYKANKIVLSLAKPLSISEKIFMPFVNFFTFFANSLARIVNPKGLKKNPFLTKDEIKSLLKDISREGILEIHEKDAIDKIFELTLTKAADVMVPLKDVVSIDITETIESIREKCRLHRFTRYPVFDSGSLKGVLNIFDLYYAVGEGKLAPQSRPSVEIPGVPEKRPEVQQGGPGEQQAQSGQPDQPKDKKDSDSVSDSDGVSEGWQQLLRPIIHVEHNQSLDRVFSKMQPNKELMAAVFKEGKILGILTMEDLMEDITLKLTSPKKVDKK